MASSATNVLATTAEISQPQGVGVDPAGNIYVSDTGNDLIRQDERTRRTELLALKCQLRHAAGGHNQSSGDSYARCRPARSQSAASRQAPTSPSWTIARAVCPTEQLARLTCISRRQAPASSKARSPSRTMLSSTVRWWLACKAPRPV